MKYLLRFRPLEGYTFGTDQNAVYAGKEDGLTGRESYYLTSLEIPEQTTLLGVLRRLVLKAEGKLRQNFDYSPEEWEEMADLIGGNSFSFEAARKGEEQSFGRIKSLSPVFLEDQNGEVLIANPFCNSSKTAYVPYAMELDPEIVTSHGNVPLPAKDAYNGKSGHGAGLIELGKKAVRSKLFRHDMLPGNRKALKETERNDAYYRREVVFLEDGCCFSLLADVETTRLPEKEVIYMGKKRSAFSLETTALTGTEAKGEWTALAKAVEAQELQSFGVSALLRRRVEAAFTGAPGGWYYALSDLFVLDEWTPDCFCILERKCLRNLETTLNSKDYSGRLRRSDRRYGLIRAGRVFQADPGFISGDSHLQRIGYDHIIKLGGES